LFQVVVKSGDPRRIELEDLCRPVGHDVADQLAIVDLAMLCAPISCVRTFAFPSRRTKRIRETARRIPG